MCQQQQNVVPAAPRSDDVNLVRQYGRIAAANTVGISQVFECCYSHTACTRLQYLAHLAEFATFPLFRQPDARRAPESQVVDTGSVISDYIT